MTSRTATSPGGLFFCTVGGGADGGGVDGGEDELVELDGGGEGTEFAGAGGG